VHLVRALKDVVPALLTMVRPGDAVITLGAGSIGTLPKMLVHALAQRGEQH
jgi:UDP-N-acetylmuramate-alanine ligase